MLQTDDIKAVFNLLIDCGYRPPWADADPTHALRRSRRALAAWVALLGNLEPEMLHRAVVVWIHRGGVFWPKPGELLQALPSPTAALPDAAEVFEWAVTFAASGKSTAHALEAAEARWGPEVAQPLTRALKAVGGTRGLGSAPIDLQWGGNPATRGAYRKRFQEAWSLGVETQAARQLPGGTTAGLLEG